MTPDEWVAVFVLQYGVYKAQNLSRVSKDEDQWQSCMPFMKSVFDNDGHEVATKVIEKIFHVGYSINAKGVVRYSDVGGNSRSRNSAYQWQKHLRRRT